MCCSEAGIEALLTCTASVSQVDAPERVQLHATMNRWRSDAYRTHAAFVRSHQRDQFIKEVEDLLREEVCDSHGNWTAHDVRLRFLAITGD
jgi:hypothetical protein